MSYSQSRAGSVPSTWLELHRATVACLFTVSFLLVTLSVATGDPEAVALIALAGVVVLSIGLTFLRLSEYSKTNGLGFAS